MAQTLALTYGRVKYTPGEPRQTSHGMRINAVITLPSGEEVKLWGDPGDPALTALKKNQQVALAQNSKGGWQLVQQEEPQQINNGNGQQTAGQSYQPWSDDEKRAIAAKVTENAKLMKFCLQQAREHCAEYLETTEDLRVVATTLFLQAVKR